MRTARPPLARRAVVFWRATSFPRLARPVHGRRRLVNSVEGHGFWTYPFIHGMFLTETWEISWGRKGREEAHGHHSFASTELA